MRASNLVSVEPCGSFIEATFSHLSMAMECGRRWHTLSTCSELSPGFLRLSV